MAPLTPSSYLSLCFCMFFVVNTVYSTPSDPPLIDPSEAVEYNDSWDDALDLNLTGATPPPPHPPVATRPDPVPAVTTTSPEPVHSTLATMPVATPPRLDKATLKIASKRPPHVIMPMGDVRVPSADAVAGRKFVTPS